MYHDVVRERLRRQGLLHSAMFELTYRCNLDCFYCYNEKGKAGTPLSLAQYRRVLADLADMNVLFVSFTGGEPLMHPAFFAIGRAARDLGFVVRVKSGGHSLRRHTARRLLAEVNPFQVELSLHGATAESHDRQTRVAGSFSRLIGNIAEMRAIGLRTSLVCTLTAWNEHEIDAMLALAGDLGIALRWQGPVSPRDDGDVAPLRIQPSEAAWQRLRETLTQRDGPTSPAVSANDRGSREHWCGAGSDDLLIDPFGNVFPCLHLRLPAGNLHRASIREIWEASSAFGEARTLAARTALDLSGREPRQLGAPVFCPGLDRHLADCSGCKTDGG